MNLSIPKTKRKSKNAMSRRERMLLHRLSILDAHKESIGLVSQLLAKAAEGWPAGGKIFLASTLPLSNRQVFDIWIHRSGLKQIVMATGRIAAFDETPEERPNFQTQTVLHMNWPDELDARFMVLLDAFSVLSDAHMYINLPKGEHGQYILGEAPVERVVLNAIQFINEKAKENG